MEHQKNQRMLEIFFRALKGEEISLKSLAEEYQVSTKSISRDISEIQDFLTEHREASDDNELTEIYDKMKNASAGSSRFPVGTDQTIRYQFDLQNNYQKIDSFEWIDYQGGILKTKNAENAEEFKKIKNDIAQSDVLYIFVDGDLFKLGYVRDMDYKEKIEHIATAVEDGCARKINHFLSDYQKANNTMPLIAIVITKYDIVHESLEMSIEDSMKFINEVIKMAFSPLFPNPEFYSGYSSNQMVGIIPVSLGVAISENDYQGVMKPINMHIPIFMGIWFMLKKSLNDTQGRKRHDAYTESRNEELNMLAREIEKTRISFFLNGQSGNFHELAEGYLSRKSPQKQKGVLV